VLVIDNGSGVGAIVLQLAKHWGHLASATCSAANVPRLAQILASANARSEAPSEPTTEEKPVDEKVVDYEGNPKWDLQLNAQGKGFDVVIDTVGSQETEAKSLSLLNCSGHYISLHSLLLDSIHENGLFMVPPIVFSPASSSFLSCCGGGRSLGHAQGIVEAGKEVCELGAEGTDIQVLGLFTGWQGA